MKSLKSVLLATAVAGALALSSSAHAVTIYSDLSAWEAAVGSSAAETTTFGATNFADFSSFTTTDGVTIDLAGDGNQRTIGSGWATWCCGYTGQVEDTSNFATSQTWTFVNPVTAFGVFLEPDNFATEPLTMALGSQQLTQDVNGASGAKFFGFVGSGVSSVTFSNGVSDDFAAGDVFTSQSGGGVPEPAAWAMMLVGFAGLGAALRRRQALAGA